MGRKKEPAYFFEIRQYARFVRLRTEHVITSVANGGRCVELLLLIEGKGEEAGRGIENGSLQRTRDTMARDLEEAGADTGGADVGDDALGSWASRVRQERSNVNGWHVEISARRASRSHSRIPSAQ